MLRAILAALLAVPFVLGGVGASRAENISKPDIIVIMVDDLAFVDDERILSRLPNTYSLFVEQGLRFNRSYSETTLCCPGRASFLTGQHTRKHGVTRNDARLLKPENTIATVLDAAGYATGMFGKYLNLAPRLTDKTPPGWDRVVMSDSRTDGGPSTFFVDGLTTAQGFRDRFTADETVAWYSGLDVSQPAFAWTNSNAPHRAAGALELWQPAVESMYVGDSRCDGIEPYKPPDYMLASAPDGFLLDDICRSMLTFDEMVGSLREVASARGRPTLWLFTSDNGMAWGRDGFPSKAVPKADRLPLYFSGEGVVPGQTEALVSNIDISPTLAAIAGTTMPFADGVSYADVLSDHEGGREWLMEDFPVAWNIGTGGPWTDNWWSVRKGKWRIVVRPSVWTRLYNTDLDPWEQRPIRNRKVIRELMLLFPY